MWSFISWFILIVALFSLLYYRVSPKGWIPIFAIVLLVASTGLSLPWVIIFWVIWGLLTFILLMSPCRIRWITHPFLNWFRQQQPALSQAEKEVLEAGGVWWESEFFSGRPKWTHLMSASPIRLSDEEQAFLDDQTETLCRMLNNWEIQKDHRLPLTVWNYIKKEGFWALIVEKKYGGHAFSAVAHSTIITKIASHSVPAAIMIMVPNALGPAEFLTHYGTLAQKEYYLPRLAKGEEIGCFALTAPEAGSDASSISDVGIVEKGQFNGKEIIGIRLNWNKRYITLAPIATLIGLVFKLYDPHHLLGEKKNVGITIALLPADLPGIEKGLCHEPLNIPFLNGPIRGKDVFIPMDFILGGVNQCGTGWIKMMECLSLGRGISLSGLSTGGAKLCFRMSSAYSQIRQQFKRPIGEFEGIKQVLAQIGGYTYLCEALRLFTATAVDRGARPSVASAITKYHVTELSRKIVNFSMDLHGGRGIQMGPHNYLGSLYQAAPIGITVEGANILTRNLIIYGQGVMRCHPYLRDELIASENPESEENLKKFDRLLLAHVGFVLSCTVRAVIYGLTGGKWIFVDKKSRVMKYLRQMTRMSNALIWVTDVTLAKVGSKLKLKESLSARLGDVLSYLYMGSSVVKLYVDEACKVEDWAFVEWALQYCLAQIQLSLDEFFMNFPSPLIGKLMRFIVFPWGRAYHLPCDKLSMEIAELMQQDLDLRDRMTRYCYINDTGKAAGLIEKTFNTLQIVKPLLKKLDKIGKAITQSTLKTRIQSALEAKKLTKEEHDQLMHFAALYWEALQVDEFVNDQGKLHE